MTAHITSSQDDAEVESGVAQSHVLASLLRSRADDKHATSTVVATSASAPTGATAAVRSLTDASAAAAVDRAIREFAQRCAPELHAMSLAVGVTTLHMPFLREPLSGVSASVGWAEATAGWTRCMVSTLAERA